MDKLRNLPNNNYENESSEELGSEMNLELKYELLERNHRRLLGVASALTEALENMVRGSPTEMEQTLNQCMDIYPELFSLKLKKPSHRKFKTIYNTSVSEDISDVGEIEEKSIQNREYPSNKTNDNLKYSTERNLSPKDPYKRTFSKAETATQFTAYKVNRNNAENPKSKVEKAPIQIIYKEPTFEILRSNSEETIGGYPISNNSNILPLHLSPSPDNKGYTFSPTLSTNESSVIISPVTEKEFHILNSLDKQQTPGTESSYTVKHPESDTDTSSKTQRYFSFDKNASKNRKIYHHEELEKDVNEEKNVSQPYEITVHKSNPSLDNNNAGVSIKIIPDMLNSSNKRGTTEKKSYQGNQNPIEACIIIKSQLNSKNGKENNKDFTFDHTTEKVSFNVTIAKLQSLGNGLRVQADIMQPVQSQETSTLVSEALRTPQSSNEIQKTSYVTDASGHKMIDEPTKIALLNSYDTDTKPNLHDPAFDQIKGDYLSIKSNLINGSVKQRSLILQSLRLNLIHTLAKERSSLLASYIDNDILNINESPTLLEILMPQEIINGWDLILQQMIFKFLNTMSSMWKGRDYLTSSISIIDCLQKYFHEKFSIKVPSEMISKDMLIATLHKLSTRFDQQMALVSTGVSEKVLFSILENSDTITPYRLRHSLGLLINLSVSSQGRKLLEPMVLEVLTLLATLLRSKEKKIMSCTARLLYILMASEIFHKEAKNMELIKFLGEPLKTSNKRIKLQLETLKSAIEQGKPHTHLQNAEMTYLQNIEPEIDELEEEVEIGEPGIANTQSELYKKYGLDTEESRKLSHIIQDREQIRNIFKVTENQNQNGESNVTDDDTTSTILNEDNKSTSELGKINETDDVFEESTDSKNKKSGTKGKNRKSKKRDTDTMSMLSSNYALLKEALDNIIDDQANYNIIPENASEKLSMKSKDFSIDNKTKQAGNNKKDKLSIASKTNPSSAQDPEKSKNGSKATNSGKTKMSPVVSHEIQSATPLTTSTVKPPTPPATSSKIAFAKTSVIPEIKKDSPETSPANPKSRPASQKSDHLTLRSRKHSIYSQDGQSDYEYCEDTKQIQMPIQFDNIFSESRQSPYKGLLSETAKSVAVAKPETSGDHTKSELPTPAKDNSPACDNSQTEKTVVLDPKDIHSPTE